MEADSNPAISTVDSRGVPYNVRLKRLRESIAKSPEELAALLGIAFREYDEWESYEGELSGVLSLDELSELASVLGVCTRLLFEDELRKDQPISLGQLGAKVKSHLDERAISISEFEDRVGYEIQPALGDPSEMLKWNVDCLRCVCAEIGVDWLTALP